MTGDDKPKEVPVMSDISTDTERLQRIITKGEALGWDKDHRQLAQELLAAREHIEANDYERLWHNCGDRIRPYPIAVCSAKHEPECRDFPALKELQAARKRIAELEKPLTNTQRFCAKCSALKVRIAELEAGLRPFGGHNATPQPHREYENTPCPRCTAYRLLEGK